MHRIIIVLLPGWLTVAVLFFPVGVFAKEKSSNNDVSEIDKILREYADKSVEELVPYFDPDTMNINETAEGSSLTAVLNGITEMFFAEIGKNADVMAKIIFIALFGALLAKFTETLSGGVSGFAEMACGAAMVAFVLSGIAAVIDEASMLIDRMTAFLQATVPILTGLAVSSGAVIGAGLVHPVLIGISHVTVIIFKEVVFPLIIISITFSAADALTGKKLISSLGKLIRKICYWIIGITMSVFAGTIMIRGIVGSAADETVGKTAKYAIGNFIPVVGGFLSDAADTILSGLNIIKNVSGVAVICGLIVICAVPVIKIGVIALMYRCAGIIIGGIVEGKYEEFLEDTAAAFSGIAGITAAAAVMSIFALAGLIGFT